jgi:superfamily I DNA/RNA helicase
MTNIIFTKATNSVDGAIKKKVFAFMEKLSQSDELVGLHIEKMKNPKDSRVRTGRVDDNFRAVLFRLEGAAAEPTYVYVGTWPHDEAIAVACSSRLQLNPVNGVAELIAETAPTTVPSHYEPAVPTAELEILGAHGVTSADLTARLGLDASAATRAFAATTDDELLAVAEALPAWQGIAILDLASGTPLDQVLATLDVEPIIVAEGDDDQALIEAMQHPAAKMTFAYVHSNEELRKAIEDDSFADWRVFLHPEQRRYVERDYNGPFRLSGGAGTGKTVVLLHRARRLALAEPGARVLLTTYTVALADNLRRDLLRLDPDIPIASKLGDPGVFVVGIDALASALVKRDADATLAATGAVLGEPRTIKGPAAGADRWDAALAASGVTGLPPEVTSAAFLADEYESIILPHRLLTREQYFSQRRPGRRIALDRAKRDAVWKIVSAYRALQRAQDLADFDEIAAVAAHLLDSDPAGRPVDHVLVDEGQDLVPTKWLLLRALAAEDINDLFIAEDSHQRIYGRPTVLSRWGIKVVGRSQRLRLNYRTTAQNLAFAVSILQVATYEDLEAEPESTAGYRSSRTGPPPSRQGFATLVEELDFTASLLSGWLTEAPRGTVAVLVRTKALRDMVARGLSERGTEAEVVDTGEHRGSGVAVMTMHKAKGLEFSRVCVMGAGRDNIPNPAVLKAAAAHGDEEDALLRERSLLYVATSRARDAVEVTWTGPPSVFLTGPGSLGAPPSQGSQKVATTHVA